jgi:hypothetical protein
VAFFGKAEELLGDTTLQRDLGLTVPPIGAMTARLRELGAPVPATALDAESVVNALWR